MVTDVICFILKQKKKLELGLQKYFRRKVDFVFAEVIESPACWQMFLLLTNTSVVTAIQQTHSWKHICAMRTLLSSERWEGWPGMSTCVLLLQETDDEDEESCYIKECLQAFIHWLQGLSWFQRLTKRRQTNFEVICNTNQIKSLDWSCFQVLHSRCTLQWVVQLEQHPLVCSRSELWCSQRNFAFWEKTHYSRVLGNSLKF